MTESESTQYNKRKLYIRNLDFNVIRDDIHDAFSKHGKVIKCDVPMEKPGKCKG